MDFVASRCGTFGGVRVCAVIGAAGRLAIGCGAGSAFLICERKGGDRRAVDEANAARLRMFCEEILEDAAIELVGRRAQIAAGAQLDDSVDALATLGEEKPEAELLQLLRLEMFA